MVEREPAVAIRGRFRRREQHELRLSPERILPVGVLERLRAGSLCYPSAGGDIAAPIGAFASWLSEFWFVDVAYTGRPLLGRSPQIDRPDRQRTRLPLLILGLVLLGPVPAHAQTAPVAPSGLTASAASSSQVSLTWTDNSDNEFAFAVWRQSGGGAFARVAVLIPNTTSFTDTGLTPGTAYTYEVRATNNVGASPWSNQATVALVPPAALSNLAVSGLSAAAVALTWTDNSNNETAFAVWRSAGGGAFARVAVLPPNSTSYTDTAVSAETTYSYEVRATNNVGASPWSNQTAAAPTNLPPAAPTGLVTTAVLGSQVTLSWIDNSSNETAFAIWRQGGGADWARVGVVAPNTTAFTDASVGPSTTYTYQVRAIDNVGASDWSNQVTATTLFDTEAVFALSDSTSSAFPAWSIGGGSTVAGGCGSNGLIYGSGGPTITVGPVGLWGPNASITGVTTTGVQTIVRSAAFTPDTADTAANLFRSGTPAGSGVANWAPTGYDVSGNSLGPADAYGRIVNSQAEIVTNAPGTASDGVIVRSVKASEFLDANSQPVLDGHLVSGSGYRLRLKPGVYYFAAINLLNSATVEIANDWYRADGVTPLWDANHIPINGPPTTADYDSMGNRITLFVDAVPAVGKTAYVDSGIGSGLYTALRGDQSAANALRYRRPGNFRLYAKNTGNFSVTGNIYTPVEFNADVLHYNQDSSGNYYGAVTLKSNCHLYGGLFGWTVNMSGGATVQQ